MADAALQTLSADAVVQRTSTGAGLLGCHHRGRSFSRAAGSSLGIEAVTASIRRGAPRCLLLLPRLFRAPLLRSLAWRLERYVPLPRRAELSGIPEAAEHGQAGSCTMQTGPICWLACAADSWKRASCTQRRTHACCVHKLVASRAAQTAGLAEETLSPMWHGCRGSSLAVWTCLVRHL